MTEEGMNFQRYDVWDYFHDLLAIKEECIYESVESSLSSVGYPMIYEGI